MEHETKFIKDSYQDTIYRGQVVYIYSFDLAYDMKRGQLTQLLGQPVEEYSIAPDKRSPKQLFFYRPHMVKLPPQNQQVYGKTVQVQCSIKLFDVGAISIQVQVPFSVNSIADLVKYHSIQLGDRTLDGYIRELADKVLEELRPYCIRPVPSLGPSENYTVFYLKNVPKSAEVPAVSAEQWLMKNRSQVAALLTEETNASDLYGQEANESTELYLTYYDSDLVVIDWDAALVLGELDSFDDVLHIMEIANVQLVELEAYDRILDIALEVAYRDMSHPRARMDRRIHQNLRELRVDMARLSDEFLNITGILQRFINILRKDFTLLTGTGLSRKNFERSVICISFFSRIEPISGWCFSKLLLSFCLLSMSFCF
jgi:hypothetical protein